MIQAYEFKDEIHHSFLIGRIGCNVGSLSKFPLVFNSQEYSDPFP